jgi:hypothetical protein
LGSLRQTIWALQLWQYSSAQKIFRSDAKALNLNKVVSPINYGASAISVASRFLRSFRSGGLLANIVAVLGTNPKFRIVHGLD